MNVKTVAGHFAALCLALGLVACGQKGPLRLPDSADTAAPAASAASH